MGDHVALTSPPAAEICKVHANIVLHLRAVTSSTCAEGV